ncbi:Asp-tRNA(Asn)/Glu-tRNA(Gln) amidotransferase subunit GatC [Candidatus Uhrbacteria bacterium]|nr:Asp-tRNA(Asn)/Glu-tRNA(Gln) amidotransferase subunit GatC [Candidatus Uhrbacteria bacterium]
MEDIKRLAELARLSLTEEEEKEFASQMTSILSYVGKIQELQLPVDAPEMVHAVSLVNVWRNDVAEAASEEQCEALRSAFPESVARMNAVPAVFEEPKR